MSQEQLQGELEIRWGDPLRSRLVVDYQEREFLVIFRDSRLTVCDARDETPLGIIKMATPVSGAIWKASDCIGEYFLDAGGSYNVVSVCNGFKSLGPELTVHPLLHLLGAITSSARSA